MVPLKSALQNAATALLELDFKTLRTLASLWRPGWTARRYLDGHRAPYASPVKTALTSSVALLLVAAIFARGFDSITESTGMVADLSIGARDFPTALTLAQLLTLLPFAGLVALLMWGKKQVFLGHLTFTLYLLGAINVMSMVTYGAALVFPALANTTALVGPFLLVFFIYLFIALRTAYRTSWLRALLSAPPLGIAFFMLNFFFMAVVVGFHSAQDAAPSG